MKIVFLFGVLFMLSAQPILLMGSLIGLVLIYSLYIYMASNSFWFSYIFMLVMMSGVLVLFSYLLSLFPNSEMEFSNFFLVGGLMVLFYMFSMEFFDYFDVGEYMLYMWGAMVEVLTFFFIFFLFMMMVIVVWVSMMDEGSLRENLLCAWLKG